MTTLQMAVTIGVCMLGTIITRFLPYVLFLGNRPIPAYVQYLGKVLGPAVFGLLVVYCLRHVNLAAWPYGIPEGAALLVTWTTFMWRRSMMLSMAAGTAVYMALVQTVFAAV